MGVERWRRGLEESSALSSYALIIQLHKASDSTVYGFCNVVKKSQQLIYQRKHSFYLLNMKSGKTTTDRWRQKEGKFNVLFIAGNDHIKPQICNQEKKDVSGKKIQGTQLNGNMLASVVDVITVTWIRVSGSFIFIFTMLYLENNEK